MQYSTWCGLTTSRPLMAGRKPVAFATDPLVLVRFLSLLKHMLTVLIRLVPASSTPLRLQRISSYLGLTYPMPLQKHLLQNSRFSFNQTLHSVNGGPSTSSVTLSNKVKSSLSYQQCKATLNVQDFGKNMLTKFCETLASHPLCMNRAFIQEHLAGSMFF